MRNGQRPSPDDSLGKDLRDLNDAYALLVAALGWESERIAKTAQEIARTKGAMAAKRFLRAQTEHIRNLAIR